ncbi:MAG TPA: TIGR02996 domain-containing protein [Pirellulales bacterium]
MDDEASFLRALLVSPDDEALRAIYADWLDERGETAKAEYLRLGAHGLDRIQRVLSEEADWRFLDDDPRSPVRRRLDDRWNAEEGRRKELNRLRPRIDPRWWAFMETLGCPPRPFHFSSESEADDFPGDALPLTEPLVARGAMLTWSGSFQPDDALDNGLAGDLRLMLRLRERCTHEVRTAPPYAFLHPFIGDAWPEGSPVTLPGLARAVRARFRPGLIANGVERISDHQHHAGAAGCVFLPDQSWEPSADDDWSNHDSAVEDSAGDDAIRRPWPDALSLLRRYAAREHQPIWMGVVCGGPCVAAEPPGHYSIVWTLGVSPRTRRLLGYVSHTFSGYEYERPIAGGRAG